MLHVQGSRMDAARISQALQLLQVIVMVQLYGKTVVTGCEPVIA